MAANIEDKSILDHRMIYLSGDFCEESAQEVVASLLLLDAEDPTRDIILFIDSLGGDVYSFYALHDAIKLCRCDVATVAIGKAMSSGQMLLMSGTKGKRFACKNCSVLMHSIQASTSGDKHQMENEMAELRKMQLNVEALTMKYTKIKPNQMKKLMMRDTYLSAEEALKYGIVDHIINSPADLHNRVRTK